MSKYDGDYLGWTFVILFMCGAIFLFASESEKELWIRLLFGVPCLLGIVWCGTRVDKYLKALIKQETS